MSKLIRDLYWFFLHEPPKESRRLLIRLLKSRELFSVGLRFRNLISSRQFELLLKEIDYFWRVAYEYRDSSLMNQIWLYEERLGLYVKSIQHEYMSYSVTRATSKDFAFDKPSPNAEVSIFLKEFSGTGVGNGILMFGLLQKARTLAKRCHVVVDQRQITLWRKNLLVENGFEVYSFEGEWPASLKKLPRLNISILKNHFVKSPQNIRDLMGSKLKVAEEDSVPYRKKYSRGRRLIVGLNYKSRNSGKDSPSLAYWCRLVEKVPATYVLVQYDVQRGELTDFYGAAKKSGANIIFDPDVPTAGDLYEFAAQLSSLDLLVSIPSTASFYSTALGLTAFVVLDDRNSRQFPIFSNETPWHPTTKIFRKDHQGYEKTFDQIGELLCEYK